MEILLFFVLLIIAVIFFIWIMKAMTRAACPHCLENGRQEMVLPIIPGFRWFCPACSGVAKYREALDLQGSLDEEE